MAGEKEKENSLKYLGSIFNGRGCCTDEIRSRIYMGRAAFGKVRGLITVKRIPLKNVNRFDKYFVWSVVLYT